VKSINLITLALITILALVLTLLGLHLSERPLRQSGNSGSGRIDAPLLNALTRNLSTDYCVEVEQSDG
jgi:hypothetical protein